ncbi:TonB-dependent siderophore receptor [Comamonadaceae bacterium OH2545_COT-014]|nr:TonB-dependent siderophore receptor [Comamonadaceae bacterium OH2545_COT-014]
MPAPAAYRPRAHTSHTSHNGHATAPACPGARPTRRPYPNNPPARLRPAVQAALSVLSVAACGLAAVSAGLPLPARAQAASPAASEAATPQSWQLPAGPLAPALRALAAQANLLLSFTEAQTAGKTTSGLRGRHTPQAALHALLAGTGLQAAPLPGGGYTLRAAPASTAAVPAPARPSAPAAPAAMPGAAQTLPAVTVTAAPDLSGTTEGTRSFTTRAMASATGLALSPRETPQSVSVITRERIEAQGMSSLSDAVAATPGVYTAPYDGRGEEFSARGFFIHSIQVDGVSMEWESGWSAGETRNNLAMYDRVEVVRGAGGLMTGTGEPSASVNMIRKRADSDVFTGQVQGELGSWKNRSGMVDLSAPLNASRSVRARVVAQAGSRDTFRDREHFSNSLLYGTVEADLSDATRLTVGADWKRNRPRGIPWGGLIPWYSDGSRIDWQRGYSLAPHWSQWHSSQNTVFAKLSHQLNSRWKLEVDAQKSRSTADVKVLWPEGWPDRATGLGLETERDQYDATNTYSNINLRIQGGFDAWGRQHELTAGLSSARHKLVGFRFKPGYGVLGSIWDFDGQYPEPDTTVGIEPLHHTTTRQRAIHAATRLHLTEPLKLIAGARLTNWERQGEDTTFEPAFRQRHSAVMTPYIGAVYDINNNYSAYASATRIFNPQKKRDRHGGYLDPLKGQNLEAGLKAEWLDGQLNGSLAVFQTTQDNFGVEDGNLRVPGSADEQAWRAAKGVKTRGYELELAGRLAPGWDVGLGWTQFSSKDASGERVGTTRPGRMLKLHTQYRLGGAWSKLTLGGGLHWQGRIYKDVQNPATGAPEQLRQNAYALLNLSARYQFTPQLAARLAVNNVLDKKYWANVGFFDRMTYGAPRSVMLTVDYRW